MCTKFQQYQFGWWDVINRVKSGGSKYSSTSRVMAIPFNAFSIFFRRIHTIAFECALPCLLLAQLFKVQVNLSWWLAVWSQEVASVKGGCKDVVWGGSGGIRH